MSAPRRYKVVDVFSATPLLGNPVAVILDSEGLDGEAMQAIARWTNLSETTFLVPPTDPDADYGLRIFTPASELPFAGHPTLGSAFALIQSGLVTPVDGRLRQQSAVGLVDVVSSADRVTLTLPAASLTPLEGPAAAELEQVLGAPLIGPPALIDVGPKWIVAQLTDADVVVGLEPNLGLCAALETRLGATGVTVFGPLIPGGADIEVRSFCPSDGISEDPVCGSGNGAVAVYRRANGLLPAGATGYLATQGCRVGRRGEVHVGVRDDQVTIGGACVTTAEGLLTL